MRAPLDNLHDFYQPQPPSWHPQTIGWYVVFTIAALLLLWLAVHLILRWRENRYRREAERHYQVLNDHLKGRDFIVGGTYTIADMSAWGWLMRAPIALPGEDDPLAAFPNVKRLVQTVDARPAAARAKALGKDHPFKREMDEGAKRAMFPTNYPEIAM